MFLKQESHAWNGKVENKEYSQFHGIKMDNKHDLGAAVTTPSELQRLNGKTNRAACKAGCDLQEYLVHTLLKI